MMAVNLRGVFLACKVVLPAMRARRFGRIINIASGTVFSGPATRIHYVTSKAGVLGFTRTLAREVGAHGITVNTIAPGMIDTERLRSVPGVRDVSLIPLGRVGDPAEIAAVACFLASDRAGYVTGAVVPVDGGLTRNLL